MSHQGQLPVVHVETAAVPDLPGGRLSRWRPVALALGLAVAVALPWLVYPPLATDILAWGLFAISVDLLLGYGGLLSFGHAAFWGASAYTAGLIALNTGLPFPVAVLGGAVVSMVIALPTGWLAVRRSGIYFAMVTLAYAQMLFFLANQARSLTGGENGLQGIPKSFFGLSAVESDPFMFYFASLPILLLGIWWARRTVRSPFGRVLMALRDNPDRARSLGYDVEKYKLRAFVISAGLAGLAGGVFAISHGFASLQDLSWSTSGEAVLVAVLGGIGTLWGGLLGAGVVVLLEDWLASSGFDGLGIVMGTIFIVIVLLFRRGLWGSVAEGVRRLIQKRARRRVEPLVEPPRVLVDDESRV